MSIFSDILTGLSNAEKFVISIFTRTSQIAAIVARVSPGMLSVLLATCYDAAKALTSTAEVAGEAASGNAIGAITLSPTTLALWNTVITDLKNDEAAIVADWKALSLPAVISTTPVLPVS